MAAFPNNPVNGQQATVNGITYTYNVPPGVWAVTTVPSGNATVSQLNATTIVASGTATAGSVGAGLGSPGYPVDIQGDGGAIGWNIRGRASDGIGVGRFANNSNTESARIRVDSNGTFYIFNTSSVSERMRITSAGNVGIGTTSPASTLDVNGQTQSNTVFVRTTAGVSSGFLGGVSNWTGGALNNDLAIGSYQANMSFFTNNNSTERLRLDPSGNLILGFNQPTTQTVGKTFTTSHAAGNRGARVNYGISDGSFGGMCVYNVASSNPSFNSQFVTFETHEGAVSAAERMRITATGLVGIGTSTPSQPLVLQTASAETSFQIACTSTNGKAYELISGGTGGNFAGGKFGLFSRTDSYELLSATSNTAASAGGTTGRAVGFAHAGFWMDRGWADFPSITVCNNNVAGNTNQSQLRMHGTNCTWASYPATTGPDFSCSFFIDGTYQTGSDRRFKTNITSITGALDKVMKLDGKRFQTINRLGDIEQGFSENGYRFGFIAQDIEATELKELYKHNIDEDDGTEGFNKAYSVEYDAVIPLLVNAMKEQQAMIEQLKSEISSLKISIENLK